MTTIAGAALLVDVVSSGATMNEHRSNLSRVVTFYATFDEEVRGDCGGRVLTTRSAKGLI